MLSGNQELQIMRNRVSMSNLPLRIYPKGFSDEKITLEIKHKINYSI